RYGRAQCHVLSTLRPCRRWRYDRSVRIGHLASFPILVSLFDHRLHDCLKVCCGEFVAHRVIHILIYECHSHLRIICRAKPVIQELTLPSVPICAVPVFAAMGMDERAGMAVPDWTTSCIMSVICLAVSELMASEYTLGFGSSSTLRSGPRTDSTSCGVMTVPSLAIPAAIIFICRAVARTSTWPNTDCASVASGRSSVGKVEASTDSGMLMESSLKPKRSATSSNGSWPISMAAEAKGVLQDCAKIQVRSAESRWSQMPPAKLEIEFWVWGSGSSFGTFTVSSGLYSPDSSIAMVSMSLKVEPGWAISAVGWLR